MIQGITLEERDAIRFEWNGHNEDEAVQISHRVMDEGATVWATKECDSRLCRQTHIVFHGPNVFATSICTSCQSALESVPLAVWNMKEP